MLKMHAIEIFTCNNAAYHTLENLSQRFLSNVLNFHGNMSLQRFDGGWRSGKNLIFYMPCRKKSNAVRFGLHGAIAQWKRVCH